MSVPNNTVFTNNPGFTIDQSIFESTQPGKTKLGTRIVLGDRTFRYAQAAAALSAGSIVAQPSPVASHQSGLLAVAATSAGAKILSITSSALVAAGSYAEGFFGVATGAAVGELYRVKTNLAGSTGFSLTLYDGLNQTITSGTGFFLVPNPYSNVNVGSLLLSIPAGVVPCAVSSGDSFWLQTYGPCNVLHESASPAGVAVSIGSTGGVVPFLVSSTAANNAVMQVGKNSNLAATAGQTNPIVLTLAP